MKNLYSTRSAEEKSDINVFCCIMIAKLRITLWFSGRMWSSKERKDFCNLSYTPNGMNVTDRSICKRHVPSNLRIWTKQGFLLRRQERALVARSCDWLLYIHSSNIKLITIFLFWETILVHKAFYTIYCWRIYNPCIYVRA